MGDHAILYVMLVAAVLAVIGVLAACKNFERAMREYGDQDEEQEQFDPVADWGTHLEFDEWFARYHDAIHAGWLEAGAAEPFNEYAIALYRGRAKAWRDEFGE